MPEKQFAAKISQTSQFTKGGYGFFKRKFFFGPRKLQVSKEPQLLGSEEISEIRQWIDKFNDPGAYVDFFALEHTGRSSPK